MSGRERLRVENRSMGEDSEDDMMDVSDSPCEDGGFERNGTSRHAPPGLEDYSALSSSSDWLRYQVEHFKDRLEEFEQDAYEEREAFRVTVRRLRSELDEKQSEIERLRSKDEGLPRSEVDSHPAWRGMKVCDEINGRQGNNVCAKCRSELYTLEAANGLTNAADCVSESETRGMSENEHGLLNGDLSSVRRRMHAQSSALKVSEERESTCDTTADLSMGGEMSNSTGGGMAKNDGQTHRRKARSCSCSPCLLVALICFSIVLLIIDYFQLL